MTDKAPGCFGMGLIFRSDARECQSCPFAGSCGPIAAQALIELRAELGVHIKLPKPKAVVKAAEPVRAPVPAEILTSDMPKKVEALLQAISTAGIRVTEALRKGTNPFIKSPAFMKVACHLLLRVPNGFSRSALESAFMTHFHWNAGTAAAHALQSFQALTALGAADECNGILKLRKD